MTVADPGRLDRAIRLLCHAVLWLSTSVIFVILVANTVLRYITGSSLQWANEVPELLFPWLVMAGVVIAALPAAAGRVVATVSWLVVAGLYGTLAVATYRMLEIVHDEKSPILQLPGSITYGCVMVGMALLGLLALQSAWQSWTVRPRARPGGEPAVP